MPAGTHCRSSDSRATPAQGPKSAGDRLFEVLAEGSQPPLRKCPDLAGRPIQARPPGIWEHAWKAIGRQPIAAASLALGVVLLAALFGSLLFTRARLEKRLDATASALTRAEGQIEKARRERYQADMNLAQQAYQHGDFDRGLSLLAKHDGEADLRNFEWSYLWRLGHPDTFTTVAGDPGDKLLAAYSPDGAAIATAAIDNA